MIPFRRRSPIRSTSRRLRRSLATGMLLAAAGASTTSAQETGYAEGLGFRVAPAILLETDFPGGTEVGFGLVADLALGRDDGLRPVVTGSFFRSDFPVGPDRLHRYYASFAGGLQQTLLDRSGLRIDFLAAVGALSWDDRSETDPAFRSSADLDEMLLPGVAIAFDVSEGTSVTLLVRDQITGWLDAILDPDEAGYGHHVVIAAGISWR